METNESKKNTVNDLVFHAYDFNTPEAQKRIDEVVATNEIIQLSLRTSSDPRSCKQTFK